MCVRMIQNTIPIRGDPHVLVVGDPGLGKSQVGTSDLNKDCQWIAFG